MGLSAPTRRSRASDDGAPRRSPSSATFCSSTASRSAPVFSPCLCSSFPPAASSAGTLLSQLTASSPYASSHSPLSPSSSSLSSSSPCSSSSSASSLRSSPSPYSSLSSLASSSSPSAVSPSSSSSSSSRLSCRDRLSAGGPSHTPLSSPRKFLSRDRIRLRPRSLRVVSASLFLLSLRHLALAVHATPEPSATQVFSSPTEREANLCRCLCDRASGAPLQVLVPADKGCTECTPKLCVDSFFSFCGPLDGKRESEPPADVSTHCINRRAPWSQWVILSFLLVTGTLLCFASLRTVAPFILDSDPRLFNISRLPRSLAGAVSPRPSYPQ
uniref:Transmembrane protein n=1 Tax=Neospora caninum (strain Liverpool) TaxID=572307 RepID=A0A0F7UQA8_NEOCL|nr:TPA: hypothetical protein BN1204_059865 [Neospora caninum Liverpool]